MARSNTYLQKRRDVVLIILLKEVILHHLVQFSVTEREGLAQSEGASGKLIDQRLGNVRRQVQGRVFMQLSFLLKVYLTGSYNE